MKCPHCGHEFVPLENQRFCSYCGGLLDEQERKIQRVSPRSDPRKVTESEHFERGPDQGVGYVPWEDLDNLGFFQGLLQTVQRSLFSPQAFFSRLPVRGGFLNPLLYGVIVQTVGNMVGYLSSIVVQSPLFPEGRIEGNMMLAIGLLIPIIVLIWLVLWALLLHVSLFLAGGANQDVEASFRIVCYSSAADLFNAIPVLGGAVALAWKVYILILGAREVNRISTARATGAVLLPLLVCCGVAGGIVLLTVVSLGGAVD